jgi:hypothetical protein
MISLNQKVWPAQSSCNLELKRCNTVIGDWMSCNQQLIQKMSSSSENTVSESVKSHSQVVKSGSDSVPI